MLLARLTAELTAIPPALVVGPVRARITDCLTAGLAQAGQTALDALDGQRYLRLLDDLDALLADPPLTPLAERKAGKVLFKPVRRAARRLQRALAAVPAAGDRDAAIHEARKATKPCHASRPRDTTGARATDRLRRLCRGAPKCHSL